VNLVPWSSCDGAQTRGRDSSHGTSKGIGYEATLLLARAGHEVIATMRNPSACDLEKVATEAKLPVPVLPLDVDDDISVADVFAQVGPSVDVPAIPWTNS
jgi:NAD(P)-dependent dehydrogenase (short-subunit alcohol dehydrogenase family)